MAFLFSMARMAQKLSVYIGIYSAIFCLLFYSSLTLAIDKGTLGRSLIHGVPYISWNEAMQLDYTEKDITNPSAIAAMGMILKYWNVDIKILNKNVNPFDEWETESQHAKDFNYLKPHIDRGIPIYVSLPLTSNAHPYYLVYAVWLEAAKGQKDIDTPNHGVCSWMSGKMAPLEWYPKFREAAGLPFNPLNETVLLSPRIVIGYDDDREMVILHDPIFGPALEVDYVTFDHMWRAMDRSYGVLYPKDHVTQLKQRKLKPPYRQRTPNEQAAFYLLEGCGFSVAGEYDKAEEYLNKGLILKGISNGYRHMLLIEIALHQAKRGAYQKAIASTQKAIELLPDNYYPWEILANFYSCCRDTRNSKKEKQAQKRAESLRKSTRAIKELSRALPSDYWIPALSKKRGWGFIEPSKKTEEDLIPFFSD
ncbi:MAG: hypothetical protein ABW153_14705 [Sedimenticola sp.]